jgi:hypothetical protein
MFRRSILYHHASLHNLHRPIFVPSISDALRSQQDSEASRTENFLRLAAVNCDEFAVELNVLEGKPRQSIPDSLLLMAFSLISLGSCFGARGWNLSNSRSRLQAGRINRLLLHSAARYVVHIHINCSIIGTPETKLGRWKAYKWRVVKWVAWNRSAIR